MVIGSNSCVKTLRNRATKLNSRAVKLHRPAEERVNAEDLMSLLSLYDFGCFYCCRRISFGGEMANGSFDHVVPLGRGGRNVKRNLVPACRECNNIKGDRVLSYGHYPSGVGRIVFKNGWRKNENLVGE